MREAKIAIGILLNALWERERKFDYAGGADRDWARREREQLTRLLAILELAEEDPQLTWEEILIGAEDAERLQAELKKKVWKANKRTIQWAVMAIAQTIVVLVMSWNMVSQ